MALEDLTGADKFITNLVNTNPLAADDRREGDDHIRGIKNVLHNTFPNLNAQVTSTPAELDSVKTALQKAGGTMTGPILFPDGTAAAPAVAFAAEATLGMWRSAAGQVGFVGGAGYTYSGTVYAPGVVLKGGAVPVGQAPSLGSDANNYYVMMKNGTALVMAYADGACSYVNGASGKSTVIQNAAGDFASAGNVYAKNGADLGLALVHTGNTRQLRFTGDAWKLEYGTAASTLTYYSATGAILWQTSNIGNFFARSGYQWDAANSVFGMTSQGKLSSGGKDQVGVCDAASLAGVSNRIYFEHQPGVKMGCYTLVNTSFFAMDSSGTGNSPGGWVATSDRRVKTNIAPILDALWKLEALGGYTFDKLDMPQMDGTPTRRAGLIAQEVQGILPEAVSVLPDERGTLALDLYGVVGLLVSGINELTARVAALEAR